MGPITSTSSVTRNLSEGQNVADYSCKHSTILELLSNINLSTLLIIHVADNCQHSVCKLVILMNSGNIPGSS